MPKITNSGLWLPDGCTPVSIFNNSERAQDTMNVLDNNSSYLMYLWRLLDLAMSVFEWHNLPRGVDERMLELWLIQNGFCVFFYDEDLKYGDTELNAPEGYAVLQAMIAGQWDMYNYPRERRAYAVNGLNVPLDETNSVLIFNDYLRVPMFMTLDLYARRLAEIDRTIDVNVRNQKTPKILRGSDKQLLTMKNVVKQIDGNVYNVMVDKNFDVSNIETLDLTAPYVSGDLNVLKHQYWNEALTYLGIENVNTEKKERLVSDEVMSNMGDVEAQRFVRLNARVKACDEINELFGLDVDVTFRSGTYIKADGYGAQQIATTGMQVGSVTGTGEGTTGYESKLKTLIGRL